MEETINSFSDLFLYFSRLVWSLCLFSVLFYLIGDRLLKKVCVRKGESINFAPAHETTFLVPDNKFEFIYPFLNKIVFMPIFSALSGVLIYGLSLWVPAQMWDESIQELPFIVQVFLALFVWDLSLYVRHRFVHEYMWSFHAVHHCAKKINWMTTTRVHPVDTIVMGMIHVAIMHFIGFSGEAFAFAYTINGFWNYFVHMNICLDFPKPFKYIFGSPNFHRWHHSLEAAGHNKNYCIMFSCIDYVMGTYYCPDHKLPQDYGCSLKGLDDIENKTIWNELWYPLNRQIKKLKKILAPVKPKTDP